MTIDYRDTVFLPKTDFPMKAGLPQKEPGILARWQEADLYRRLREAREGREKFILHDGPPYANGDMHIGHALNHTLKDMVCRTHNLLGMDAPYVPGWDCHGLPIEWKVEEEYRKKKRNKDEVPPAEFRAECRAYARHWVNAQREQLKRLGIMGDWDNPYLTMDFQAEATIVAELMKFATSGQLYRGAKPVMWSPVEKTALAEAEVEYEDVVSTQIDVAFEIVEAPNAPELVGAHAVIWTTTPWTIPVNQALAYGKAVGYSVLRFEGSRYLVGSELIVPFMRRLSKYLGRNEAEVADQIEVLDIPGTNKQFFWGSVLAGAIARHPIAKYLRHSREGENPTPDAGQGELGPRLRGGDENWERMVEFFERPRPFLPGDFVTTDAGTGLVHMAPDHGEDDFDLCKANGIDPVFAVDAAGMYRADWAWLGGQGSVINKKFVASDGPICADLRSAGALLAASDDFTHSYPHSWRSKAKVIYRCTPQWFVAMDRRADSGHSGDGRSPEIGSQSEPSALAPSASLRSPPPPKGEDLEFAQPQSSPPGGGGGEADGGGLTLRQTALAAIDATRWVPEKGRNRIGSMVEGRPDWVLSRQRAWGVPITLFVDRKSGQYLVDPEVNARIVAAMREAGVDAWTDEAAQGLLGPDRDPADYERVTDILDVWFDSGCTHAFVLESGKWPDLLRPEGWVGPKADLYLEGSDQHRGWFQSSLLESCGTRGTAPYKAVLTHGFTMDSKGMKMSKSLGNTVNPLDLMKEYGADILRLWALSVDFTEDQRIGKEILAGVADQYRKLRNTFRYLLGALEGFGEEERVSDVAAMPELERYILHLLADMDGKLRQAVRDFDYNTYTRLLSDFANNDLSAFYFDIRKDCLYCDIGPNQPSGSPKRRAYRTVLDTLFHALIRWAAPVLVFTSEEVWGTRYPEGGSVHLLEWPELPFPRHSREGGNPSPEHEDGEMGPRLRGGDELVERWTNLRILRAQVTEAIEPLRREKIVGSSLQVDVILPEGSGDPAILAELFISGPVRTGDTLSVTKTDLEKCGRCWRHLLEVTVDGALCDRCAEVIGA